MKKISIALVGFAALSLVACENKHDAAQQVENNYDNAADNLDAMAGNTANDAEADALKNQADQLEKTGDKKADAVDDKMDNGASAAQAKKEVNAM